MDRWEELLEQLLTVSAAVNVQVAEVAARHDLTWQQLLWIRKLLAEPQPMSVLAGAMSCDPSNATGMIDRLEKLALVERSPSPDDRRVKLLSLTRRGRQLYERIQRELVAELVKARVSDADAAALLRLLPRLTKPRP